jgi:succinoglycan biosynthesis transport protein ExoP
MENNTMNDQLLDQPLAADRLGGASGPSPWEVIWQRKPYVALGMVVGLALGVLYWSMAPKVYESTAQIWVLKKQPDAPVTTDPSSLALANYNANEDFLSTHRTLIRSAVITSDAVAKGRLTERAVFLNSKRPAYDLARALTVTRDRDKTAGGGNTNSQILNISFRCSYPEDCTAVLSTVISSYREFLDNRSQDASKQTLDLIEKARDVLQNDLEKKEKAHDAFLEKTPSIWKSQLGTTLNQERLASLDAQRTALNTYLARLRTTLNDVETALKQGRSYAELLEIVSSLPGQAPLMVVARGQKGSPSMGSSEETMTSTLIGLEQELIALQLEEGRLLEDFGPEHPRVKSLRDRMQTVRALLSPSETPDVKTAEQNDRIRKAKENLVALRIGQLKQELARTERSLQSLNNLFKEEMNEARKIFPLEVQEATYRKAIERSQTLYDTISQRLRELNVVSGSKGFETQVITPPTEAEKISPRGSIVLPLSLFLGLLLGSGLAYLAELTDKSFRSAEDIRRRLGLPIMGIIPLIRIDDEVKENITENQGGQAQPSPILVSWHRVSSREAEAYRGVRTSLYFSTHGQGRKVIQITSPNKGDGKSTLAANLAISIAQSGKNVLLVDGDLRRPNATKLFSIPSREAGFAAVLAGLAEPNEAIHQTVVPRLSVCPAGPTPPNPAELLTSLRLREVIEWMRERYDYVIIDSPPLLAVTDPGVIGPQVDGAILTLRSTKKGRVEAKRAKEILDNLGVNVFGVVLNALDQSRNQEDYGYYGYYRYYEYHEPDATRNGADQHGRRERVEGGAKRS